MAANQSKCSGVMPCVSLSIGGLTNSTARIWIARECCCTLTCKVPWHWGLTCPAFQKSIKDSLTSDDVKFMDLAKSENWQRCKKCRFYIEKSEGCPYITCRCGYRFCYDCGLPAMIDKEVRNCKCVPVNREVQELPSVFLTFVAWSIYEEGRLTKARG